jgi:hypothetical protein
MIQIQTGDKLLIILENEDKLNFNFNYLREIVKIIWLNKIFNFIDLFLQIYLSKIDQNIKQTNKREFEDI